MPVLALIDDTPLSRLVLTASGTVASLLAEPVVAVHAGPASPALTEAATAAGVELRLLDGAPIPALRRAAEADDVAFVVLGVRQHPHDPRPAGHVAEALLTCLSKPVLLVGPHCQPAALEKFGRLLVPLDGTEAAASAVREAVDLFGQSGVDIVALHVFDRDTVPAFFDQPQHGYPEFVAGFLDRHPLHPSARLALGCGDAGLEVMHAVVAEAADLIVLGWSQQLQPGRARVIRRLLADSPVPFLMLPIPDDQSAMAP